SQALGLSLADYQRLDRAVAIRHAEYDYVAAAYLGDQLLVGTWLTHCDGRLTMERQFQILRAEDGAVVLRGRWQLVSIGISSGKVQRMPREFAEIYGPAVVRSVQS
ncbi:MAG: hypothetical protein R3311_11555, partial [Oceanisphaera sp.]|nr:hypothetical protein [Oceanisphaera sp.]